tara:strand:+ start:1769 stop:2671 length:903 start_codon:yes stop_codon:yes gene_type:complete
MTAIIPQKMVRYIAADGSLTQEGILLLLSYQQQTATNAGGIATNAADIAALDTRITDLANTDYDIQLALGLVPGAYAVEKFGRNPDIDTATVPEDVWNGSQIYTGFGVGAEVASEVVSDSASDTGTVYIKGLRTPTSTEYETASYTVAGLTPVSVGSWWRANTGWYDTGDDTTFNVGTITVRQTAAPANIYIAMPAGKSATTIGCWTVPFGSTALLRKLDIEVSRASATATVAGALWTRQINESPRYQFQFVRGNNVGSEAFNPPSPIVFPAQTDISVQITSCSANNIEVLARFGLVVYT